MCDPKTRIDTRRGLASSLGVIFVVGVVAAPLKSGEPVVRLAADASNQQGCVTGAVLSRGDIGVKLLNSVPDRRSLLACVEPTWVMPAAAVG